MKTKIKRLSKRSLSMILSLLIVVSAFVVMGTVTASAWNAYAQGKIYFAMPYTWTSNKSSVQYCIVKNDKSYVQPKVTLSNIANTDLYYGSGSFYSGSYGDKFDYMEIIANSSGWGDFNNYNNSSLSHYTTPLSYQCNNTSNYYAFYYSSTEAKGISLTTGYNSDRGYALNRTQKVYAYTDLTRGGTYSNNETGGKVVASYYNLSADSTSSSHTFDTSSESGAEYYPVPCEVTLTATPTTGYEFVGWYTSASGGTALSTNSSSGITVNGTTLKYHAITQNYTIYARFRIKQYTISYNAGANGTGSVSSTTKLHGTDATLSSSTFSRSGYTQTGWSTSDGGAKAYDLGGTYTDNAAATLYPYWTKNTYTVKKTETGGSGGTVKVGSTTITTSGVSITHGSYTVTVTAPTGYNVTAVSIGGTAQSITAGSSVTINSVSINAAKTIAVTYAQKTYAITLSETGGSGTMKIDGTTRASGYKVTHGNHTFRVDAPTGYIIDTISGIGTWTKSGDNSYATLGSTSITSAQTISVTYAAAGRPSLDAIADVSKDANTTTFNVTATINDEDKKTGTLTATASSGTTSVATVGTPTVSGTTVTIPVTIKGVVGSSTITVNLLDGGSTVSTQSFSVSMAEPTFTIGAQSVYVSSKDRDGGNITNGGVAPSSIAYTSSNTEYITVNSSNGKLTAVKVPSTQQTSTITATARYGSGYEKVATYTATLNVPTVNPSVSATSGNIGDTATGSVSLANPGSSSVSTYNWTSSNSNIVSITDETTATPTFNFLKNGSATITLTVTYINTGLTKTATKTITVNAPTITVGDKTGLKIGETWSPSPTLTNPSSGSGWTVVYTKTSGTATTLSGSSITGDTYNATGDTYKASYQYNGSEKASTTFTVKTADPTITMTSTAQSVNVDATYTRTATGGNIGSGAKGTVSYSSGTPAVASVNSTTGKVTAKTPGSSVITATYTVKIGNTIKATKTATYTVNVTDPTVTITSGDKVAVGDTLSLTATSSAASPTFTWAVTSGNAYATVSGSTLTGQAAGSATVQVTATYANGYTKTATKAITVETPAITVKEGSTSVIDNTVYTTVGANKTYTVGANFSGDLYAYSSNTSVATASLSGSTLTITPKAKGTATITVSTSSSAPSSSPSLMQAFSKMKMLTGAVNTTTATFTVNVAEAESGHVVYFTDNKNWGSVDIHAWGADGTGAIADHAAMTKVGVNENNENVYAYRFTDANWTNVQHIRFLKHNQAWGNDQYQTVTITDFSKNAYYCSNDNSPRGVGLWTCNIQKPQLSLADKTINMGGTETMTATVLTSGTPSTYNWSSGTTSVATTANTNTASNVVTGVAPGTSTITVKAYAEKPSGWASIVTDGTADDFVAGTTTATATVVAENKTVTFGAKKTDDGSAFTDLSSAVTAKYYDADTSGSGSSGSGSGSSTGQGAGKYMWYNTNNSKDLNAATSAGEMIDLGDGTCYGSFTCAAGQNYDVVINNSNTKGSCLNSSTTVSGNQTWAKIENNGTTYWALDSYSAAVPIYVIYNPTTNSVRFTTSNPASGSGSSGSGSSGSGSSGTGTTGEGTTMTSPASVPYGKVAKFTAEATKTVSDVTYHFVEWVDENGNKLSSENPYSVTVNANKTVYARYYKVYKLSAFDSYELNGGNVTYKTAPPKMITVQHGTETYLYTYDGTKPTGNPNSPDGDQVAALPIESGTYGQGNYIQYYAGDSITLYYSAMASSEIFKGVFYNNGANYYVAKPTADQFQSHDYSADKTLYMNSSYYNSVPSGLPTTTVDNDAHSIQFYGNQDFKNIDVEMATKRKVYFSDYTNAIIGSKNTDDYYYDGEALSVTGDQLTVKAAGNATQTNSINKNNVKFYRADANGQPTGEALSGYTVSYDSGTDPVTNSGATASTRYIIISGTMPSYDLYIDLGMTSSYTIKLGSKVMSDSFANKTRLAEVATVTIKEGSTPKLTAPSNADVTSGSASVNSGTALTLTSAFTGTWGDYYMFVGWYWGSDTEPDFQKGFISDKASLNYTPKKGGTIWAVGTRSLYINGSKYITGKDTNWYGENNVQKNLPMSYDAESGRYYWEISDTMFAAAGSNYKTWGVTDWNEKHTDYGVYAHSDAYYWTDNDDKYHGKSFFQILDKESGSSDKTVWDSITSFKEDTPANGPTYGKIYPRDYSDDYSKKHDGQGFINFNESDYAGQSSPLRIYFDPKASGNARLTVESTKIYSNIYVSNGFDVGSTSRTSLVTVEPVVDGVVKTLGQTGWFNVGKQGNGWDPDVEGHVNHYKPQKKGATVRITKTAGGSDKISAFFIYDITNKTVRAERDVKKDGSKYYIDLTLAGSEQNLYIVPIVEEAGANVTITFDATQLNRKQWGDIVTAYAWYQSGGGNALGGYPGQPMIPSDDMTTWTAKFKGTNGSAKELEGITFSNYIDGIHSWLGCSGVMGSVSDHKTGTASGGIVNVYNHVDSGPNGEYSRTNFKAQTYDYREPIALYDRFKGSDNVSISFSMKDGNSSLISWRHSDLLSHNIVTLEPHPDWSKLNWEYLTNAKGDKYIDLNGNTMKTKPTASFYIAAKGQVLYNSSSMTNVFYSGKQYDAVSGVTYGGASGVSMNYAVQWYIYDASGNYITNVLTAGIADMSSNNVDSYIGKVLEDKGYAVDGKSVAICYDKPRYMYGDSNTASSGQAAGYNGKGINVGNDFDAYRFTGQWNAVASNELVSVKVGVGMMTDSGEVLAGSNTAAYGNASAAYDTIKGNNTHVTDEDGNEAPFTASDGSFVRTAVRDASNSPVKLNASAQNFIGWYYYDANTGDFVKASYASNENFYPNYSNKDVTFYAMYRASAVYQYKYTGREGQRTYSAAGNDLTESELSNNSVISAASHETDIKNKVPVGIGIFKKNIDFSPTNYNGWTKTPDPNGYILDITGFTPTLPEYTLTAYYKDASGKLLTKTKTATYNGAAVNLTDLNEGVPVTSYYGKKFLGWYAYDNATQGELISTQTNYGLRLTRKQDIIAVYDETGSTTLPEADDGWNVYIDENEVNKELTTSTSGVFYNDTIVRVRNGSNVQATLPSGAKIGVIVINQNGTSKTIDSYKPGQLSTLVTGNNAIASGSTVTTKNGLIITNMQATSQTNFNRTDIAVRSDFAKNNGKKYCVYAYFFDGSAYHFSNGSGLKTYE